MCAASQGRGGEPTDVDDAPAPACYRKVPKFSDARKFCCNLPKIETKRPNLKVFCQKSANGIASSEDPDRTLL